MLFQIYEEELESAFEGFTDLLHCFRLYRGKKTFSKFDERNRYSGTFKVSPLNHSLCLSSQSG